MKEEEKELEKTIMLLKKFDSFIRNSFEKSFQEYLEIRKEIKELERVKKENGNGTI